MEPKQPPLFLGSKGWKGTIGDNFTFQNVRMVCGAIAHYLHKEGVKKPRLVVGFDGRFMGKQFAQQAAEELVSHSCTVYLCSDPVPAALLAHAVLAEKADGGVMLGASDEPYACSGITFRGRNGKLVSRQELESIQAKIPPLLDSGKLSDRNLREKGTRKIHEVAPEEGYFGALDSLLQTGAFGSWELPVVLDFCNGSGVGVMDRYMERFALGKRLFKRNDFSDPTFGGFRPMPDAQRVRAVASKVRELSAALGLVLDGDASGFAIVDDAAEPVGGGEFLALVAEHLYRNRGFSGNVARSLAASHQVDRVAAIHGAETVAVPEGFPGILDALGNAGVSFGGDENGALALSSHVPEKDGILACLLALEMVAMRGTPLSELRKELRQQIGSFHSHRMEVRLKSDAQREQLLDKLRHKVQTFAGLRVSAMQQGDGMFFDLSHDDIDSWLFVRPSGREPSLQVFWESSSREDFEAIRKEVSML
ncbi:MAG TPA: hypothetical protein P5560_04295 [Thermotogota bacterium]|mgnify:CR=1 FL=1|nr:hypothetical protein [Thermotogota bacterium]HRW92153.1 hypothetical protein [Thermotogota bacterium]